MFSGDNPNNYYLCGMQEIKETIRIIVSKSEASLIIG
jgi:hypothetical protein